MELIYELVEGRLVYTIMCEWLSNEVMILFRAYMLTMTYLMYE